MNQLEVDAAELTPTVVGGLLKQRSNVPGLKMLLTIGEMLTQTIIEEFGGTRHRKSILHGMYGPTEASIHCTLQPNFPGGSRIGNIGIPLDTVSAYIIEPPLPSRLFEKAAVQVLPVGQIGELAVGGFQLANGYLNRNDLTSTAFVDTENYGRLYRTGDKARLLPDGTLECLGRMIAGQVKIRGQRIELGEIEQAVSRTPGCRNAIVSIIGSIVVAFCLVDSDDVTVKAVFDSCQKWLPKYMCPGDVVLLQTFPQSSSGKVDRRKLEEDYQLNRNDTTKTDLKSPSQTGCKILEIAES
ncbi:hypothetical protein LTR16_006530, partial [Cryomyces antarcticus]